MLEGDDLGGRAFALFLRPTPGHLPISSKKMLMPGCWPGGGGGWTLMELTDALNPGKLNKIRLNTGPHCGLFFIWHGFYNTNFCYCHN